MARRPVEFYVPGTPPAVDDPRQREMADYIQRELTLLSEVFTDLYLVRLQELAVAPTRPRDGMLAYADGVGWNPGYGEGFYGRIAGFWQFLRGGLPASFRIFESVAAADAYTGWTPSETLFLTLGYYGPDGEGAAFYARSAGDPGGTTGVAKFQLADGSWALLLGMNGQTNVLMFGAKRDAVVTRDSDGVLTALDGSTFNDSAFIAYTQFIKDYPTKHRVMNIPPGGYAVYEDQDNAGDDSIAPIIDFATAGSGDRVVINGHGATLYVEADQYEGTTWGEVGGGLAKSNFGAVIRFTDSSYWEVNGLTVEGDVWTELINTATSPIGFTAVLAYGKCRHWRVNHVTARRIMQPLQTWFDAKYECDPRDDPKIIAKGANYAAGDIVKFQKTAAVGSSRDAKMVVLTVDGGGGILTATFDHANADLGLFENSAPFFRDHPLPYIDATTAGMATAAHTGIGTGATILPYLRIQNMEGGPAGLVYDVVADHCMRGSTHLGGARGCQGRIEAISVQRATFLHEDTDGVWEILTQDSRLDLVDLQHEFTTPHDVTVNVKIRESTKGQSSTPSWSDSTNAVDVITARSFPCRYSNIKLNIGRHYNPNLTGNGSSILYFVQYASNGHDTMARYHRYWGFEINFDVLSFGDAGGHFTPPQMMGVQTANEWNSTDMVGFRFKGSLGSNAVLDFPKTPFFQSARKFYDQRPDFSSLACLNPRTQILIGGVAAQDVLDSRITWHGPQAADGTRRGTYKLVKQLADDASFQLDDVFGTYTVLSAAVNVSASNAQGTALFTAGSALSAGTDINFDVADTDTFLCVIRTSDTVVNVKNRLGATHYVQIEVSFVVDFP